MWISGMNRRLDELLILMREQNSLLRELVQVVTSRPALTPKSVASTEPLPRRIRTDKDVVFVTRKEILEQQRAAQAKRGAPWREGEILPQSPPNP